MEIDNQPEFKSARERLLQYARFILLIIGLIISAYLFYQHYLIINEANGKADICYRIFSKGCSSALASDMGSQLGLPLAGWGIIYYTLLMVLLLPFKERFTGKYTGLFFGVSLLGCAFSILLLLMIFFDHKLFCPFCVIIHGINLLLVVISLTDVFRTGLIARLVHFPRSFKLNLFTLKKSAGVILLLVCLYTTLKLVLTPARIIFDKENFIKQIDGSQKQKIIIDTDDPVSGPVTAPVQIIVFSDFECPACRNFSKTVTALHNKYPNKFYVVFKHFPLGKQCNPIYGDYDLHPKACEAARAAEAARLQGKFWQYHDLLFSADIEKTEETFSSLGAKAGLSIPAFENDRNGEVVMNRVSKTIDQGKQLGIKGTPAVFINGRLVNDSRLLHMKVLFDHLLKENIAGNR